MQHIVKCISDATQLDSIPDLLRIPCDRITIIVTIDSWPDEEMGYWTLMGSHRIEIPSGVSIENKKDRIYSNISFREFARFHDFVLGLIEFAPNSSNHRDTVKFDKKAKKVSRDNKIFNLACERLRSSSITCEEFLDEKSKIRKELDANDKNTIKNLKNLTGSELEEFLTSYSDWENNSLLKKISALNNLNRYCLHYMYWMLIEACEFDREIDKVCKSIESRVQKHKFIDGGGDLDALEIYQNFNSNIEIRDSYKSTHPIPEFMFSTTQSI
jgi:hypothetical protein